MDVKTFGVSLLMVVSILGCSGSKTESQKPETAVSEEDRQAELARIEQEELEEKIEEWSNEGKKMTLRHEMETQLLDVQNPTPAQKIKLIDKQQAETNTHLKKSPMTRDKIEQVSKKLKDLNDSAKKDRDKRKSELLKGQ